MSDLYAVIQVGTEPAPERTIAPIGYPPVMLPVSVAYLGNRDGAVSHMRSCATQGYRGYRVFRFDVSSGSFRHDTRSKAIALDLRERPPEGARP